MYIQLQAYRNNDMIGVEDGGMAIYKIVALVVMGGAVTTPDIPLHRLGFDHIEINVSADQGKIHTSNYIILWLRKQLRFFRHTCVQFQGCPRDVGYNRRTHPWESRAGSPDLA